MEGRSLGVVCALSAEATVLSKRPLAAGEISRIRPGLLCLVAGAGGDNAAAGVAKLVAAGAECIVSWGFAGGLGPCLESGRLLMPRRVLCQGRSLDVDQIFWRSLYDRVSSLLPVATTDLITVPDIVRTPADKRRLYEETGAEAVDMESAAILQAVHGRPAVVVRAVVDSSAMHIPQYLGADTGLRQVLGGLMRRPATAGSLGQLAMGYRRARATLSRVADLLGNP